MAEIVSNGLGRVWVPVCTSSAITLVEGAIVTDSTDGVIAIGAASGAFDTTGKGTINTESIPLGVVVGTSYKNPVYNSTYKRNSITSIITSNANYLSSLEMMGIEGGWGADKQAYVLIELIGPETIIRAPIYGGALGTALTVKPVASGASATGVGYTTATYGFTSVAYITSSYCRTGLNQGIYRVTTNAAHATTFTFTSPFPAAIAVGDTFVHCQCKTFGLSRLQLDATGSWVDGSAALTSDYYAVDVVKLNLEKSGAEFVDFKFNAFAFMPALA